MTTIEQALDSVSDHRPETDSDLLDRARRGDVGALQELLAAHRDGLFGIAWSYLQNREEALDACQEAVAKALANVDRFDASLSMSAWMSRIVRNVCLDRLRRLKYRRHASIEARREAGLPDPPTGRGDPERALLAQELRGRLDSAMAELRPEEREVLFLRDGLEWPYRRIETFLDLSHGTVASLIHRARARLKERLAAYVAGGETAS